MAKRNQTTSQTDATQTEQAAKNAARVEKMIALENEKAAFKATRESKKAAFFETAYERGLTAGKGSAALTDTALDFQLEILTDDSGLAKADAKDVYLAYHRGHAIGGEGKGDQLARDEKSLKSQVSRFASFAFPAALHMVASQHRVETGETDPDGNAVTMSVYDYVIALVNSYGSKDLVGGVYACMYKVNVAANKLLGKSESDKAKAAMLAQIDAPWIFETISKSGKVKSLLQEYDAWFKAGDKLHEKKMEGLVCNRRMRDIVSAISALRGELEQELARIAEDETAERAIFERDEDETDGE